MAKKLVQGKGGAATAVTFTSYAQLRASMAKKLYKEGLIALLGEKVVIYAARYIYTGILSGLNDTCIQLSDAKFIYNTGEHTPKMKDWATSEPTWNKVWYIQTSAIESFGKSPF